MVIGNQLIFAGAKMIQNHKITKSQNHRITKGQKDKRTKGQSYFRARENTIHFESEQNSLSPVLFLVFQNRLYKEGMPIHHDPLNLCIEPLLTYHQ